MSSKETPRPGILRALEAGQISNRQAAGALAVTIRQVQRLRRRYRTGGAAALVHRGRGQPSPQRLAAAVRQAIVAGLRGAYAGFNDVHLTEKLREVHGVAVSREKSVSLKRTSVGWVRSGQARVRFVLARVAGVSEPGTDTLTETELTALVGLPARQQAA